MMEIAGYGYRFVPRMDGPTFFWQTSAPASHSPRLLNIGFLHQGAARWGIVVPRPTTIGTLRSEWRAVELPEARATMMLNRAADLTEVVKVEPAATASTWWIRTKPAPDLVFDIPWAQKFFVMTTPPGTDWSFELKGPIVDEHVENGASGMAGVRAALAAVPRNLRILVCPPLPAPPSIDLLFASVATTGTVVARGRKENADFIETEFDHQFGRTLQSHWIRDIGRDQWVMILGQAPADRMDAVRGVAEQIATKMTISRTGN